MEDRYDKEKIARDIFENQYIDVMAIADIAEHIVDALVKWSNDEIFTPLGGELSFKFKYSEEVNALAAIVPEDPYNPRIEITLGMLREIYRDSLIFPLLADKVASDPGQVEALRGSFEGLPAYFEGGVPVLPGSQYTQIAKAFIVSLKGKDRDPRVSDNAIACRFLMFEIMLTWVFFHELGHLVQRHYLFRKDKVSEAQLIEEAYENSETECDEQEYVRFQAREVLADIEGGDLAVRYLLRNKKFHFSSIYLLYCAQYCMFNRFYMKYEQNLDFVKSKHPHPVVRNELSSWFLNEYILLCLISMEGDIPPEALKRSIAFLAVKSSIVSGVYWGNRYEFMNGSLPPFMKLMMDEERREKYCSTLMDSAFEHLEQIKQSHMYKHNFTDLIGRLQFLTKSTKEGQKS